MNSARALGGRTLMAGVHERLTMVEPGRYRHFKGGLYEVVGVATDSETEAAIVVYRSADGRLWTRSAAMFEETVDMDGAPVPRFARLSDD